MGKHQTKLQTILNSLETAYGRPTSPDFTDPLEMILFENVAYLVNDQTRERAFAALRRIGTNPMSILAASFDDLAQVVRPVALTNRLVARIREIALIALQECGGDLDEVVSRPLSRAKKALMKFPAIGEPGAEKILLFFGTYPVLALDSNGLRVLVRLGFGAEHKSYVATYRSAQESAQAELEADCVVIRRAHQLLRMHGKNTCKRTMPKCDSCPVTDLCEYYASHI